ncbi:hypothetical protein K0M31_002570 [Melipona bicolor]|uniref:CWH43-like N-terminal domain-containing protein n=1 Tax=Melipona bicolor TaxID=60889 RepID=A0AA40GHU2_9HYME|nr:hypothetical protein K0M31_002570 [Melipona bicolor]
MASFRAEIRRLADDTFVHKEQAYIFQQDDIHETHCRVYNVLPSISAITEVAALCGVTYISNRENYSVHEKIFILFMISSLTYMLTEVRLGRLVTPNAQSLQYKQALFITSLVSTVGLIIFFLKHRLLCHDLAFSWFSLCEYVIASANMGFHVTVILDFPKEQLIVGNGLSALKVD